MKKTLSLLLTVILALSLLSACAGTPAETTAAETTAAETTAAETTTEETTAAASSFDGMTLSQIIDKIYEAKDPGLMVGTVDIDLADANAVKAYTGLDSADKVAEAAASEAMIGSQAYSLVLVRVKDAADTDAVAEAMKSGIDQRKWVCVEADDLQVVSNGDVVLLIMVSSELADSVTSEDIVSAFTTAAGI